MLSLPDKSPPSTYAIAAALEKQPGAWGRVAYETLRRALIIAPGIYLAGVRGNRWPKAALFGSVSVTLILLGYYALKLRSTNS